MINLLEKLKMTKTKELTKNQSQKILNYVLNNLNKFEQNIQNDINKISIDSFYDSLERIELNIPLDYNHYRFGPVITLLDVYEIFKENFNEKLIDFFDNVAVNNLIDFIQNDYGTSNYDIEERIIEQIENYLKSLDD